MPEGDDGATAVEVAVTLSRPFEAEVTVDWTTTPGTADAEVDFTSAYGEGLLI